MSPIPSFGLYIIGDEILSGKRQDAHFSQAIALLHARGLTLDWAQYLGDSPTQLKTAFQTSFAGETIVFSFGGIGATPDDYTRQAVAAALDLPLVRHPQALAEIEAQFGEGAYPKRVLMADFPQGAAIIPNPINRVAGFSINKHYCLPGFPEMAHPMMAWVLDTYYAQLFYQTDNHTQSILIKDGIESQLIDLMQSICQKYPDIKLFSLPRLSPVRQIELGAKGALDQVALAMNDIKIGVDAIGFAWTDAV